MLFERLLSHADAPVEILPLLVDAAVDQLGATGAVIVGMGASGEGKVVASRAVGPAIASHVGPDPREGTWKASPERTRGSEAVMTGMSGR